MGWPTNFLTLADQIGKGVIKTTSDIAQAVNPRAYTLPPTPAPTSDESPIQFDGAPGRHHPNSTVIRTGSPSYSSSPRPVLLACRVVGGAFLGESLGVLEKAATNVLLPVSSMAPNPTHHWCVVVGAYLHQLQATTLKGGWNYYTSERVNGETGGWRFFPIGETGLNDVAIREESTTVMNEMPEVYDALDNNCQIFALRLVDRILTKARREKFLMANMTFGQMKAQEMTPDMLPRRTVITRIDTGEVVEGGDADLEAEPANTEKEDGEIDEKPKGLIMEQIKIEPVKFQAMEDDEISRAEMLRNVATIMIKNTPTLTEEEVEAAGTP